MFEGSEHHDSGFFQPLQAAGASLNGSTSADRTNYWEVVPSGALELALWMESDRMGYLLPALTQQKFSNQRDVVLNERRQNYENRPYGLASMAMLAALFPPDHPYHWSTIGEIADLQAAKLDEVARSSSAATTIRRTRRWRSRATSIPTPRWRWCARYFEPIDAGALVEPVRAPGVARRRAPHSSRRSRRAAAALPRVVDAGDVRPTATRISIWRPTCWRTGRRRACTGGSSTRSGLRPTCPRRRTRARSPASCSSRRRRRPDTRSPSSNASSSRRSPGWRRRADRRRARRAAACRRRRSSCCGCRPSAGSAASPIS